MPKSRSASFPAREVILRHDTSETYRTVEEAIEKALKLFGDKLNVDPDEVLQVGDHVKIRSHWTSYGTIKRVVMRGRSKTRVRRYEIQLARSGHVMSADSRRVWKVVRVDVRERASRRPRPLPDLQRTHVI